MNAAPNSFAALMSLQGSEFVEAAYLAILGRPADGEGLVYYLARIRTGYSKISVLHQLSRSAEAGGSRRLPGLAKALRRYRVSRLPLVGWIFRGLWHVEGESVRERLQRTIISELAELRVEISNRAFAAPEPVSRTRLANAESAPARQTSEHRRNLVAEKLSPRAREIFDRLTSS